jgi:predicted RND superfamily exporter protein
MAHFFDKRDPWGNRPAFWVLILVALIAPLAWWSAQQLRLENDVENWLPADDPQAQMLRWFQDHFPADDQILISWRGNSLWDGRVGRLKERLLGVPRDDGTRRNGLKHVANVVTPNDLLDRMTRQGIERATAIERLTGVLIGRGNLKVQLTERGRSRKRKTKRLIVERAKSQLGIELHIADAFEVADEFADETEFEEREDGQPAEESEEEWNTEVEADELRPHDLQIAWLNMHTQPELLRQVQELLRILDGGRAKTSTESQPLVAQSFFQAGSPVALAVTLSEAGAADAAVALGEIRRAAGTVGIDEKELRIGGRAVAASALNDEVLKAAWNPAFGITSLHKRSAVLLSAIVAVVLVFWMLRSVQLATLVILAALYTTLMSVALVPLTNGTMNMVLVIMPTLLSVLTISAAIHVVHYWKHAARKSPQTAVVDAIRQAWQPCLLASITTGFGLVSLATSPLAPVRDFGLYSALGCLISLVVVLFVLPTLLAYWPVRYRQAAKVERTGWLQLARFLYAHRAPVTIVSLVLLAVCSYGLSRFQTETKVIRYFPDDSRIVQDYEFLEQNLAGLVPVETVVRFDAQAQQELNFIERMELVRAIQVKMRAHPEISGTLSLADFQPVAELPAENASFLKKARFNKKANRVADRVLAGDADGARAFLCTTNASPGQAESANHHPDREAEELWRITAQAANLSNLDYGDLTNDVNEIARSVLKYHAGTDHFITGMMPLFLRTQQVVLQSLVRSFALAFVIIGVVMTILLKNPLAGLITMLPNVLPVGIVFGVVSWAGMAVDIGTMITAAVALGIAVDGTLHLLTWFRSGISAGMSRRNALLKALAHCGPAMWQTSAAVGVGLAMLYPADLLLISRFGWFMALLMGTALLADLVVLPALLAGPLGYLIERTVAQQNSPPKQPHTKKARLTPAPHLENLSAPTTRAIQID